MPRVTSTRKTTSRASSKTSKAKKSSKDELLEFEQFITQKKDKKNSNGPKGLVVVVIVLLLIALALTFVKKETKQVSTQPAPFKTIYLESGQQIYGRVVKEDSLYIYVDDVYYTQMETVQIPAEEEDAEPQLVERARLVARGQEVNNPVGPMQINRSKVFAMDQMGDDSEIMQLIKEMEAQQ